jgi:hypothetical protein
MYKIITSCPKDLVDQLIDAMANAGAGKVGEYSHCAFITKGEGNWYAGANSNPSIGNAGEMCRIEEYKIEMNCEDNKLKAIIQAIRNIHPYETPIIDIIKLENE